jgi:hypothetical protein
VLEHVFGRYRQLVNLQSQLELTGVRHPD